MSVMPIKYVTPDEYLDMERVAEFKHEYRSGKILAMAGAKRAHNLISNNVSASLTVQLRDRNCEVYANDMRVQGEQSRDYFYPDVVVVCGEPLFRDGREDTLLNPLIIVEVLSPSTEACDRGDKFQRYSQIESLREYLLVSQDMYRLEHFVKQPDGIWLRHEMTDLKDTLTLPALKASLSLADAYNKVTLDTPVRLTLE